MVLQALVALGKYTYPTNEQRGNWRNEISGDLIPFIYIASEIRPDRTVLCNTSKNCEAKEVSETFTPSQSRQIIG